MMLIARGHSQMLPEKNKLGGPGVRFLFLVVLGSLIYLALADLGAKNRLRVLIDVHGEELVIRDGLERIVFKPDGSQDNESIHMMDAYDDRVKDVCEPESNDDSATSAIVDDFESLLGDIIKQKERTTGNFRPRFAEDSVNEDEEIGLLRLFTLKMQISLKQMIIKVFRILDASWFNIVEGQSNSYNSIDGLQSSLINGKTLICFVGKGVVAITTNVRQQVMLWGVPKLRTPVVVAISYLGERPK
ncbi:hypothetical protein Tco_0519080 [Tanacetum coccineum]